MGPESVDTPPMMRRSATAVVERNVTWSGAFVTEPWEAGWAGEALFFVRRLDLGDGAGDGGPADGATPHSPARAAALRARVQISPDGMHWIDEGGRLVLDAGQELAFVRVQRFGGWLRLAGETADDGAATVIVYLALKE